MNILEQTHYAIVVKHLKTIKIVGKSREDVLAQLQSIFGVGSVQADTEIKELESPLDDLFSIIDTKIKQYQDRLNLIVGTVNRFTEKDMVKGAKLELDWVKSLCIKDDK